MALDYSVFVGDHLLSQDIKDITLKTFLRGSLKKETRTDQQKLLFWGISAIISLCLLTWVHII